MKTPEAMAEEYCENQDECEFARDAFLAGYKAAKEETNLPTLAKWISVKERLPEVDKYVLITHRTSQDYTNLKVMEACRISDDEYEIWGDHVILADYVDYWMPLPEAPKGEG